MTVIATGFGTSAAGGGAARGGPRRASPLAAMAAPRATSTSTADEIDIPSFLRDDSCRLRPLG